MRPENAAQSTGDWQPVELAGTTASVNWLRCSSFIHIGQKGDTNTVAMQVRVTQEKARNEQKNSRKSRQSCEASWDQRDTGFAQTHRQRASKMDGEAE